MLSSNNMLTVGGGQRQRQRGTVRVSEPATGFFITGSSIEPMNGVYIRRNPPRTKTDATLVISLFYEHEEGAWHMILKELPQLDEEESEDDEDDYYYQFRRHQKKKRKTHEWIFTDEFGEERFAHDGDTIIPGAGVRWKHVHKKAECNSVEHEGDEKMIEGDPATAETAIAEIKPDDEEELPWQVIAILDKDMLEQIWWGSMNRKERVKNAKAGKNASAPPRASLESCFAPGRWLFRVVNPDGVALRIAPEDTAEEAGRREIGEYVRVVKIGPDGDWVLLDSAEDLAMDSPRSSGRGSRARADHFYNAEYSRRQLWVRLCNECSAASATLLEEVKADETAVLDLKDVGEFDGSAASLGATAAGSGAADAEVIGIKEWSETVAAGGAARAGGFTGDLFDKPFVPRMDEGDGAAVDPVVEETLVIIREAKIGIEDPLLASLRASNEAAQSVMLASSSIPVGALVEVSGLRSRVGMQYNGVSGVLLTPLQGGRHGVRLDSPFSGKILACRPDNLVYSKAKDVEGEDATSSQAPGGQVERAARLLGIELAQLGLGLDLDPPAGAPAGSDSGWGFAGSSPAQRLGFALRAGLRDMAADPTSVFSSRVREAAELLSTELGARAVSSFLSTRDIPAPAAAAAAVAVAVATSPADTGAASSTATAAAATGTTGVVARSPEIMLRFGALGSRAAAALVSALSPCSSEERDAGLQALRTLVRDEQTRARAADAAVFVSAGEDSGGGDELLLRLGLVQALLDGRRETEALAEAKKLMELYEGEGKKRGAGVEGGWHGTTVLYFLSRCLLRQGQRVEGLDMLERAERLFLAVSKAEAKTAAEDGESSPHCSSPPGDQRDEERAELLAWLRPLWRWGGGELSQVLVAHRAAERCRMAAIDTYARGAFEDAAALFGRALALLQAGCSDDKRGRATVHADRAGCLRRARKLDEAVADLDAALRLFPRYTRALFRRAACLLEAGKATLAVDGFKDLYRVDRNWPMLSEWLVRAYSLQKRQAKGYKGGSAQYEDPTSPTSPGADSSGGSGGGGKEAGGIGASPSPDADLLAREVDHYTVLGVSTDATEKQLKTAYRMRSLQFHPDRKQGNTAAFQRIAEAYEVLSDSDKRRAYDEGGDIKVKRGRKDDDDDDDDDSEEDEEHKTTMREEVEREYYPERYHYWPFGDPFIYKRKHMAQKKAKEGRPKWSHDEEDW